MRLSVGHREAASGLGSSAPHTQGKGRWQRGWDPDARAARGGARATLGDAPKTTAQLLQEVADGSLPLEQVEAMRSQRLSDLPQGYGSTDNPAAPDPLLRSTATRRDPRLADTVSLCRSLVAESLHKSQELPERSIDNEITRFDHLRQHLGRCLATSEASAETTQLSQLSLASSSELEPNEITRALKDLTVPEPDSRAEEELAGSLVRTHALRNVKDEFLQDVPLYTRERYVGYVRDTELGDMSKILESKAAVSNLLNSGDNNGALRRIIEGELLAWAGAFEGPGMRRAGSFADEELRRAEDESFDIKSQATEFERTRGEMLTANAQLGVASKAIFRHLETLVKRQDFFAKYMMRETTGTNTVVSMAPDKHNPALTEQASLSGFSSSTYLGKPRRRRSARSPSMQAPPEPKREEPPPPPPGDPHFSVEGMLMSGARLLTDAEAGAKDAPSTVHDDRREVMEGLLSLRQEEVIRIKQEKDSLESKHRRVIAFLRAEVLLVRAKVEELRKSSGEVVRGIGFTEFWDTSLSPEDMDKHLMETETENLLVQLRESMNAASEAEQEHLCTLKEEVRTYKKNAEDAECKNTLLTKALDKLRREHSTEFSNLRGEIRTMREVINDRDTSLREIGFRMHCRNEQYAELEADVMELKDAKVSLEENLQDMQGTLQETVSMDDHLSQLKQAQELWQKELLGEKLKRTALSGQIKEHRKEIESFPDQIRDLRAEHIKELCKVTEEKEHVEKTRSDVCEAWLGLLQSEVESVIETRNGLVGSAPQHVRRSAFEAMSKRLRHVRDCLQADSNPSTAFFVGASSKNPLNGMREGILEQIASALHAHLGSHQDEAGSQLALLEQEVVELREKIQTVAFDSESAEKRLSTMAAEQTYAKRLIQKFCTVFQACGDPTLNLSDLSEAKVKETFRIPPDFDPICWKSEEAALNTSLSLFAVQRTHNEQVYREFKESAFCELYITTEFAKRSLLLLQDLNDPKPQGMPAVKDVKTAFSRHLQDKSQAAADDTEAVRSDSATQEHINPMTFTLTLASQCILELRRNVPTMLTRLVKFRNLFAEEEKISLDTFEDRDRVLMSRATKHTIRRVRERVGYDIRLRAIAARIEKRTKYGVVKSRRQRHQPVADLGASHVSAAESGGLCESDTGSAVEYDSDEEHWTEEEEDAHQKELAQLKQIEVDLLQQRAIFLQREGTRSFLLQQQRFDNYMKVADVYAKYKIREKLEEGTLLPAFDSAKPDTPALKSKQGGQGKGVRRAAAGKGPAEGEGAGAAGPLAALRKKGAKDIAQKMTQQQGDAEPAHPPSRGNSFARKQAEASEAHANTIINKRDAEIAELKKQVKGMQLEAKSSGEEAAKLEKALHKAEKLLKEAETAKPRSRASSVASRAAPKPSPAPPRTPEPRPAPPTADTAVDTSDLPVPPPTQPATPRPELTATEWASALRRPASMDREAGCCPAELIRTSDTAAQAGAPPPACEDAETEACLIPEVDTVGVNTDTIEEAPPTSTPPPPPPPPLVVIKVTRSIALQCPLGDGNADDTADVSDGATPCGNTVCIACGLMEGWYPFCGETGSAHPNGSAGVPAPRPSIGSSGGVVAIPTAGVAASECLDLEEDCRSISSRSIAVETDPAFLMQWGPASPPSLAMSPRSEDGCGGGGGGGDAPGVLPWDIATPAAPPQQPQNVSQSVNIGALSEKLLPVSSASAKLACLDCGYLKTLKFCPDTGLRHQKGSPAKPLTRMTIETEFDTPPEEQQASPSQRHPGVGKGGFPRPKGYVMPEEAAVPSPGRSAGGSQRRGRRFGSPTAVDLQDMISSGDMEGDVRSLRERLALTSRALDLTRKENGRLKEIMVEVPREAAMSSQVRGSRVSLPPRSFPSSSLPGSRPGSAVPDGGMPQDLRQTHHQQQQPYLIPTCTPELNQGDRDPLCEPYLSTDGFFSGTSTAATASTPGALSEPNTSQMRIEGGHNTPFPGGSRGHLPAGMGGISLGGRGGRRPVTASSPGVGVPAGGGGGGASCHPLEDPMRFLEAIRGQSRFLFYRMKGFLESVIAQTAGEIEVGVGAAGAGQNGQLLLPPPAPLAAAPRCVSAPALRIPGNLSQDMPHSGIHTQKNCEEGRVALSEGLAGPTPISSELQTLETFIGEGALPEGVSQAISSLDKDLRQLSVSEFARLEAEWRASGMETFTQLRDERVRQIQECRREAHVSSRSAYAERPVGSAGAPPPRRIGCSSVYRCGTPSEGLPKGDLYVGVVNYLLRQSSLLTAGRAAPELGLSVGNGFNGASLDTLQRATADSKLDDMGKLCRATLPPGIPRPATAGGGPQGASEEQMPPTSLLPPFSAARRALTPLPAARQEMEDGVRRGGGGGAVRLPDPMGSGGEVLPARILAAGGGGLRASPLERSVAEGLQALRVAAPEGGGPRAGEGQVVARHVEAVAASVRVGRPARRKQDSLPSAQLRGGKSRRDAA